MTSKLELLRARRPTRERLIVALDVDDLNQAKAIAAVQTRGLVI